MAIRLLPYARVALIYGDVRDTRRRTSANRSGRSCLCVEVCVEAARRGRGRRRGEACADVRARGAHLARSRRAAASTARRPKKKPSRYLIWFVRLVQNKLLLIQMTDNIKPGPNRIVGALIPFILWLQ